MAVWFEQRRSAISMLRIGPANACTDTTDLASLAMESPKAQPRLRSDRAELRVMPSAPAYFGHAVRGIESGLTSSDHGCGGLRRARYHRPH
jgi:hypothetical protein